MKIYGYTEEKETVAVDLSVKRIVAAGIDPWRLDLFDPDPIELPVREKKLYFRRLRDLSFAYREKDGSPLIIGMHDGAAGVCFRGGKEETGPLSVRLRQLKLSDKPFEYHLCRYLQMAVERSRSPYLNFSYISRALHPADIAEQQLLVVYTAKPVCAVEMRGDELTFDTEMTSVTAGGIPTADRMHPLVFTGEMMDELTIPAKLMPEVNWLFTLLEQHQIVIYGEAIRKSLRGKPAGRIEFMIRREAAASIKQWLGQFSFSSGTVKLLDPAGKRSHLRLFDRPRSANNVEFEIGGHYYYGRSGLDEKGSLFPAFVGDGNRFSPDCLFSDKPDTVCGARIALFDAGAHLARPLYANYLDDLSDNDKQTRLYRAIALESEGTKILEPSGCAERRKPDPERTRRHREKMRSFLQKNFARSN